MANSRPLKMAGFQAPMTGWFWAPADNEKEQVELLGRLKEEGRECKALLA
jgi:hypothetical protein